MVVPAQPETPGQATRARLFAALLELQSPATTADLAARLNMHPNGVRRHLERLHHERLVDRGRMHGGRGRPCDVWSVAPDAQASLDRPRNAYVDLARWLARAMPSRPGPAHELEEAGRRIGRDLAPAQPGAAISDFVAVFRRLGFDPSIARHGDGATCVLGRCPYTESVRENPQIICMLHRGITEGLLDRIDPGARMTRFVARDPDQAGCEIVLEGLQVK